MKCIYRTLAVVMLVLLAVGAVSATEPQSTQEERMQNLINTLELTQKALDMNQPVFEEYDVDLKIDLRGAIEALTKEFKSGTA